MTCVQAPFVLASLTRSAPAVPLGEKEIVPALPMTIPSGKGLFTHGLRSR